MQDETPAQEAETSAAPSVSEIFSQRHQAMSAHEPHREVGAAPSDEEEVAPAAAETPATPAPAAAPEAPSAPAANAGDANTQPAPEDDPKAPKWYRESMKRQREENARLRAQIEGRRPGPAPQPQPQPRPQPRELPNPAEDPVGYARAVQEAAEARAADQFRSFASEFQLGHKLNYSADRLIERHGEDTLDEVREWLISKAGPDGSNPMESWAMAQRDPWSAAHQQMQRERLAEEIGSDPEAYKRKLREEWEREQAEKQAEPAAEPAARTTMTPQRPPPPAPASQARSAQPRDDGGRFAGPAPLKFKNRF
jgi:hypothetical protein